MIAFIGTGHLGANFVRALLQKGEQVQVWNRTFEKAKALEADGAKAFEQLTDVVKGATRIHLTLKDDGNVDDILEKASAAFEPGTTIIDHTTTSTTGASARTEHWKNLGFTYLHAPVFMGPQNARESTGYMLVSGDQSIIKEWEPALSKMTGHLLNLGTEINKAAGMKLTGNLFLIGFTAAIADSLALAKGLNISAEDAAMLFKTWNPAASMPARLKKLMDAQFDQPTWELNMARKDAGLMIAEAQANNAHLIAIPAIANEMDSWIEKGHGNDDWTVIGKDAI